MERLLNSALPVSIRRAFVATGRNLRAAAYGGLGSLGIIATLFSVTGCYTYLPRTMSELPPNSTVAAEISDVGRVSLAPRVGQEVASLEGVVAQRTDTAVALTVSNIRFLNGLSDHWQGQDVSLRAADVRRFTQRTFSRSRTTMMIGALAAGLVATIVGLNILGITSGDSNRDKPGDPPPET